jgi:NAD(P)-dependent dehydrogenase (short-subunit alcohol dehydrogenase family)
MADVNSMQGKRAIVTGGGTGLGAATALGLARRGVNVCIIVKDCAQPMPCRLTAQGKGVLTVLPL